VIGVIHHLSVDLEETDVELRRPSTARGSIRAQGIGLFSSESVAQRLRKARTCDKLRHRTRAGMTLAIQEIHPKFFGRLDEIQTRPPVTSPPAMAGRVCRVADAALLCW